MVKLVISILKKYIQKTYLYVKMCFPVGAKPFNYNMKFLINLLSSKSLNHYNKLWMRYISRYSPFL